MDNLLKNIVAMYAILALFHPSQTLSAAAHSEEEAGTALIESLTPLPKVLAKTVVSYRPFEYAETWSRPLDLDGENAGRTIYMQTEDNTLGLVTKQGLVVTINCQNNQEQRRATEKGIKNAQLLPDGRFFMHYNHPKDQLRAFDSATGEQKTVYDKDWQGIKRAFKTASYNGKTQTVTIGHQGGPDVWCEALGLDGRQVAPFSLTCLDYSDYSDLMRETIKTLSKSQVVFAAFPSHEDKKPQLCIYDSVRKKFFTRNMLTAENNCHFSNIAWCNQKIALLFSSRSPGLKTNTIKFFKPNSDTPENEEYICEPTYKDNIAFAGLSHAVAVENGDHIDIVSDHGRLLQRIEHQDRWKMLSIPNGFVVATGKKISCFKHPLEVPPQEQRLLPLQEEKEEFEAEPRPIRPSKCKTVADRILSIFAYLDRG